jgi:predicted RNase H-like HicB family nuclease
VTLISGTEHSYLIVIERGEGNYGAWAPDLPGCVAVGDTIEECEREMREAVQFHLEGLRAEASRCRSRLPWPPQSSTSADARITRRRQKRTVRGDATARVRGGSVEQSPGRERCVS